MDIPDQRAFGIPVMEAVTGEGNKIILNVKAVAGVFEGYLEADERISGTWRQNSKSLPLVLNKLIRPQHPKGPLPYRAIDLTFPNS
ncbi:MAG: hypothetical protein EHM28_00590 [Spirochaetaceae bacterium]|nr:MAG: hypothetical protein EHM28_00590 [Spirochaetaceae bacterium]